MIYQHHQVSQIGLLCGMMQRCWKHDPVERPPVKECTRAMRLMVSLIAHRKLEMTKDKSETA